MHMYFTANSLRSILIIYKAALCLAIYIYIYINTNLEREGKTKKKKHTYTLHVSSLPLCVVFPFYTRLSRAYLRPTIINFFNSTIILSRMLY